MCPRAEPVDGKARIYVCGEVREPWGRNICMRSGARVPRAHTQALQRGFLRLRASVTRACVRAAVNHTFKRER